MNKVNPTPQLLSPELRHRPGDWNGRQFVDVFVGGHYVQSYELPRVRWEATWHEQVMASKAIPVDYTPQRVVPTRGQGEVRNILG